MANLSPYDVTVTGTDDETFEFSLEWQAADGTAFPFADFKIEYVVSQDGSQVLLLDQNKGVTILNGVVTFSYGQGLEPGRYEHGCRVRNLLGDRTTQVFSGAVIISEGQF